MLVILRIVIQKLIKKKWLTVSLVFGMTICVALLTSIPYFSNGILQRVLIQELENIQTKYGQYPGLYTLSSTANLDPIRVLRSQLIGEKQDLLGNPTIKAHYDSMVETHQKLQTTAHDAVVQKINLALLTSSTATILRSLMIEPAASSDYILKTETAHLRSIRGLNDHIKLVTGRFPSPVVREGVYEALISTGSQQSYGFVLDEVYTLRDPDAPDRPPLSVRPVGVFTRITGEDLFWNLYPNDSDIGADSFFVEGNLISNEIITNHPDLVSTVYYKFLFDYHRITVTSIGNLLAAEQELTRDFKSINRAEAWTINQIDGFTKTIKAFVARSFQMTLFGWCLNINIIFLLLAYIFMTAWMIVDQEKNEISMLASRGARKGQIVAGYLLEGLILGLIALFLGPLTGILIVKLVGATNGFLQFVGRSALPVLMNAQIPLFSLTAILVSLLMIIAPVLKASSQSIITYKQSLAVKKKKPLWQKLFLDLILIAIAIATIILYSVNQAQNTGAPGSAISAGSWRFDPFLFIMPIFLITGLSFLFMRLYPFIIRFVFLVGKKFWGAVIYITLLRINRNFSSYHFLAFFLIMTLAVGIFSASTARTINQNVEDRIYYANGADITLKELWPRETVTVNPFNPNEKPKENPDSKLIQVASVHFTEPDIDRYRQMEGVKHVARVLKTQVSVEKSTQTAVTTLMAIDPYDFGNVAWFRDGLLRYHINEYLNALTKNPDGCLISRVIRDEGKIKVNDIIQVRQSGSKGMPLRVIGIIDFWPSWDPYQKLGNTSAGLLIVANYNYVREKLPLEPYEVWLSLKNDSSTEALYEQFKAGNIPVSEIKNSRQDVIKEKNDPFQLGLNGMLTIGFLISLALSCIGFFLYWAISFKTRSLQFGIFRALGLSARKIVLMIVIENILITGVAIVAGFFIGVLAGKLLIPFYQNIVGAAARVPPFRIINATEDQMRILIVIGVTILVCIGILSFVISRLKIGQTLKLGED